MTADELMAEFFETHSYDDPPDWRDVPELGEDDEDDESDATDEEES